MEVSKETIYRCEKCGATFLDEDVCKHHEEECDGVARGKRLANELTDLLNRLRFDEQMVIETELGHDALEAVYDEETKRIVVISM